MKKYVVCAVPVLILTVVGLVISSNIQSIRESLTGYQEVPAVSTTGSGQFTAQIAKDDSSIDYVLSYAETESPVTQSHIHFGQTSVNGGIMVFLCSNLGNGPADTQPCPSAPATITGTLEASDMVNAAAAQGIAAGEFGELLRALRSGNTYVNVHTTARPGGEIRSQIDLNERRHH